MVSREQAKERLKTFFHGDWKAERRAAVERLAPGPRGVALVILSDGEYVAATDWAERNKARVAAAQHLDALGPDERSRVFDALYPSIADDVEQAWSLYPRLPYQNGYNRKAFRAPNTPLTSQFSRFVWLETLLQRVGGYDQDVTWLAAWAAYLGYAADTLGILFAAAIDRGGSTGDSVFDILCASARGGHEIGAIGRHVTRGLLLAPRPEGWEFVERLLLAAQREEGLRQVILETIDEAHPEAFRRMLRLILEHDLVRFSATVHAADVWFGLQFDSADARSVTAILAQVSLFLAQPAARTQALATGDGPSTYLALWSIAFEDAAAAVIPASALLADSNVERRFAGVHLLAQLGLIGADQALLPALGDPDLRVVARVVQRWRGSVGETLQAADLFERCEAAMPRLPRPKVVLPQILWPWLTLSIDRAMGAEVLIESLGSRPPGRLIPYLATMNSYQRRRVATLLAAVETWDAATREAIFSLVADSSPDVREVVLKAVSGRTPTSAEIASLERLLTRKSSDLRQGVLSILLNQDDEAVLVSADRLLAARVLFQRLAGLELLRQLTDVGRQPVVSRGRAERYRVEQARLSDAEETLLDVMVDHGHAVPTLDDALGLLDPAQRTKPVPPVLTRALAARLKEHPLVSHAALSCVESLSGLISQQHATPVTMATWRGATEMLLGNTDRQFPRPDLKLSPSEDAERLPLRELWLSWWNERPANLRDADGLELLRALAPFYSSGWRSAWRFWNRGEPPNWLRDAQDLLYVPATNELMYAPVVEAILQWLLRLCPPRPAVDYLLDATECSFTLISLEAFRLADADSSTPDLGRDSRVLGWFYLAGFHHSAHPEVWTDEQVTRRWHQLRWLDEPAPGKHRQRPHPDELLTAFQVGAATEADVFDQLLGVRPGDSHGRYGFGDLANLTARKPSPLFDRYPALVEIADRCRRRILEVELARGDLPTAASGAALALGSAGGTNALVPILQALGPASLARGSTSRSPDKVGVLSHLIRVTFPTETDTLADFADQMSEARISSEHQIELAIYAPHWARHVEHALGWPGLAEAVWWIHAHTKDSRWVVDREIRDVWAAQVGERTPLSSQSLLNGAVDVAWFQRMYRVLGPERWNQLNDAAKYASSGLGHGRARVFADAMIGRVTRSGLVERIKAKRHQDSVRALGLLPLPTGVDRDDELLDRYRLIQEFVRSSRQYGAQRQVSEKLAASIALENLARTAGYPDPQRLEWAMEARAVADLIHGPVTAAVGDVVVSLAIDDRGEPDLTVTRNGKPLKAAPPAVKKAPQVAELYGRRREIRQQAARMRLALEQAMCRGDRLTGAELRELLAHPVLAPMLRGLVFTSDAAIGYPIERGFALELLDGATAPIGQSELLRIVHAHDLLATGAWHRWQHDCFTRERIQPFKQVFRELYVLTQAERGDVTLSSRYAGHQVQPRQALALFGQRGWVSNPEEGLRRTFHDLGLSAWVTFLGWTLSPADVEGLTIEGVGFSRAGQFKPLPLDEIPPRVFSEVMRDIDLVVSVAHRGGVDPEASASTVEMRASLLQETCGLLKLKNVTLRGVHAIVQGQLGSYSIHLGSAVVHRQPGGALCIVPVHAQHRGRIFLPFVDDDPRTAEVVSKVLLLARDSDTKDPTILERILG